jgi:ketosteroid isomerase-like protein
VSGDARIALARGMVEQVVTEGTGALLDRYDEVFTEDFRWRPSLIAAVEGGEYRGRTGFAQYWKDFEASFTAMGYRNASFRTVGNDVVLAQVRISVQGTESGVPLEQEIAYVLHFRGDRIAAGEAYMDPAEAEAAVERSANA